MSTLDPIHKAIIKKILTKDEQCKGKYIANTLLPTWLQAKRYQGECYNNQRQLDLISSIVDDLVYHSLAGIVIYELLLIYTYANIDDWRQYIKSYTVNHMINSGDYDDVIDYLKSLSKSTVNESFTKQIYYHGTTDKFDKFNQPINWFTTDKNYAEEYASWLQMPHAYIYKVNLNLSNTLDCGNTSERINTQYITGDEKFNPHFRDIMSKLGLNDINDVINFVDKVCKEFGIKHIRGYVKHKRIDLITRSDAFRELCLSKGYTGIKCLEKKDDGSGYATTYGIFNTDDIQIINIEEI